MRICAPLELRNGDMDRLARMARSRAGTAGLARRARIVLLAADGIPNTEIAARVGVSVPTVRLWRSRYISGGIGTLGDVPRPGRPRSVDEVEIVLRSLEQPPPSLGAARWSSRLLASQTGVSGTTVTSTWRKYGLRPWRQDLTFATDPKLGAGITEVLGLYLQPPHNAVTVRVSDGDGSAECPVIRAAGTDPAHPPALPQYGPVPGRALLPTLERACVRTGPLRRPRRPPLDFLDFLDDVAASHRGVMLHVIVDRLAGPRHPQVERWFARQGQHRALIHTNPVVCAWLELVEIVLSIAAREPSRAGFVRPDIITARIGQFIDGWSPGKNPFRWTGMPLEP
jgi:transposase